MVQDLGLTPEALNFNSQPQAGQFGSQQLGTALAAGARQKLSKPKL